MIKVDPPITTVHQLETLDKSEILEGYQDAFNDDDCIEGKDNRSDAYKHGWNNGYCDRKSIRNPNNIILIKDMRKNNYGIFAK